MKLFQAVTFLFLMALITLLITGCAGFQTDVREYNNLPDNAPKGYVEFYSEESKDAIELNKNIAGTWSVHQYEDGIATEIEGMVWDWRTRRRIAVRPGKHTFAVKLASAEPKITVDAIEGMIIPVRVIIELGDTTYGYKKIIYNFNMTLSAEGATPFVE